MQCNNCSGINPLREWIAYLVTTFIRTDMELGEQRYKNYIELETLKQGK